MSETPTGAAEAARTGANRLILQVSFGCLGEHHKADSRAVQTDAGEPDRIDVGAQTLRSPLLKDVRNWIAATGQRLRKADMTFPSPLLKAGLYTVATANLSRVDSFLRERGEGYSRLVDLFCSWYEEQYRSGRLFEDARLALGSLYNANHYPTPGRVRGEFGWSYSYLSTGVPDALGVVDPAIYQRELDRARRMAEEYEATCKAALRQRFADLAAQMREALKPKDDGKPRKFYGSHLTNLAEFLHAFHAQNTVTNYAELEAEVARVRRLVDGVDADLIRDDGAFRERLAESFGEVGRNLDAMAAAVPSRVVRFDD